MEARFQAVSMGITMMDLCDECYDHAVRRGYIVQEPITPEKVVAALEEKENRYFEGDYVILAEAVRELGPSPYRI